MTQQLNPLLVFSGECVEAFLFFKNGQGGEISHLQTLLSQAVSFTRTSTGN